MKLNKVNQKIFIGSAIYSGVVILLHLIMFSGKTIKIDASTGTLGSPVGIGVLLGLALCSLGMEYGLLKLTESKIAAARIFAIFMLVMGILPVFIFGAGFLLFFFK